MAHSPRLHALLVMAAGLLVFLAGYGMESVTFKQLLLLAFAGVAVSLASVPNRWAVRILFVYLGFEGMLKILTGYNPVVHVGSDLLILMLTARWTLLYLLRRAELPSEYPPLLAILAAHLAWFLIEFANPYSLGLVPSLAGMKVYVDMALLYAFGFYLARDAAEVRWFMGAWVVTAAIQTVTGLYQAAIGPASVLALSPNYADPLRKFAGYAFRPFGTTHLAGGAAEFIYMASPFIVYFVIQARSAILRLALLAMMPAAVAVMALCQVRSALFKAILGCAGFLLLGLRSAPPATRKRILLAVPAISLVLALALPRITSHWIEERSENAMALERTMTLFDYERISGARSGALDRIVSYAERVPLGAGLSRAGAAAGAFAEAYSRDPFFPQGFFSDNFWAATIAEVGIPGSAILTLFIVCVLFKGYQGLRRIRDPELAAIQAAVLCSVAMLVSGLWGAEGILYNPEAAFFWFFCGVMMRLPTLETL